MRYGPATGGSGIMQGTGQRFAEQREMLESRNSNRGRTYDEFQAELKC